MLAALDAHRRAAEIKRMGVLRRFPGVEKIPVLAVLRRTGLFRVSGF